MLNTQSPILVITPSPIGSIMNEVGRLKLG